MGRLRIVLLLPVLSVSVVGRVLVAQETAPEKPVVAESGSAPRPPGHVLEGLLPIEGGRIIIKSPNEAEMVSAILYGAGASSLVYTMTTKYPDERKGGLSELGRHQHDKEVEKKYKTEFAAIKRAVKSMPYVFVIDKPTWRFDSKPERFVVSLRRFVRLFNDPAARSFFECEAASPHEVLLSLVGGRGVTLKDYAEGTGAIWSMALPKDQLSSFDARKENTTVRVFAAFKKTTRVKRPRVYGGYDDENCHVFSLETVEVASDGEILYAGK